MKHVVVLLLGWAASASAAAAATTADDGPGPWQKVREEAGIVVHQRRIPGETMREFVGRAQVDAPLAEVIAVIADAEHRTEWMHKCAASRLVETVSERVQISYNRTSAPWPVADRDVVLRGELQLKPGEGRAHLVFSSVTHPSAPLVRGVVRMPRLGGHWTLVPSRDGATTRVEYQVQAYPGGALPDWIANLVSKQLPWKTIQGLREQLRRRRYPTLVKRLVDDPEYQAVLATATAPAP